MLIIHLSEMLKILDPHSIIQWYFFLACFTQLEVQTEHSKRARFGRDERPPKCPIKEGRFLTPTVTATPIQSPRNSLSPQRLPSGRGLFVLPATSRHC